MTIGLAALHALLFVLAFPPVNIFPAVLLAPAPLAWLALNARSTRGAILIVFLTQVLMWLWLDRWLIPVSMFGYPLLAVYMSLWPIAFVWLIRRGGRGRLTSRWPMTVVVPVCWIALEFLRGEVVGHGYPWYLLAHPLIEWPVLVQSADIAGTYFISLIAAMCSGVLVDLLRTRFERWRFRSAITAAAVVVALHAANLGYGLWRVNQEQPLRPGPAMLIIQTNLPQSNKIQWSYEQQVADCQNFLKQTIGAAASQRDAGRRPALIIWPETMLPGVGLEPGTIAYLLENDLFPGDLFFNWIATLTEHLDTPILVGSPAFLGLRVVEEEFRWDYHYNSAYLVTGEPPYQRYDKMFLTPFGETMPYISAWPWLEQRLVALGAGGMTFDLDANPHPALIELSWKGEPITLATPICFEDTVADVCRSMVHEGGRKRPAVLVSLSNDGWFGDSDGGRARHAQIARFRCIQNRTPMVRVANTGFSIAIDSNGEVVGRIGPGRYGAARRSGYLAASLSLDGRRTLYSRIGDFWAWICPALTAVILAASITRTKQ